MINKFFHKLAKWSLNLAFKFQALQEKCMSFFEWAVRNGYFELPYTLEEIEANQNNEQKVWEEFQKIQQRRNNDSN
jgi:hypothetical protein